MILVVVYLILAGVVACAWFWFLMSMGLSLGNAIWATGVIGAVLLVMLAVLGAGAVDDRQEESEYWRAYREDD